MTLFLAELKYVLTAHSIWLIAMLYMYSYSFSSNAVEAAWATSIPFLEPKACPGELFMHSEHFPVP